MNVHIICTLCNMFFLCVCMYCFNIKSTIKVDLQEMRCEISGCLSLCPNMHLSARASRYYGHYCIYIFVLLYNMPPIVLDMVLSFPWACPLQGLFILYGVKYGLGARNDWDQSESIRVRMLISQLAD